MVEISLLGLLSTCHRNISDYKERKDCLQKDKGSKTNDEKISEAIMRETKESVAKKQQRLHLEKDIITLYGTCILDLKAFIIYQRSRGTFFNILGIAPSFATFKIYSNNIFINRRQEIYQRQQKGSK